MILMGGLITFSLAGCKDDKDDPGKGKPHEGESEWTAPDYADDYSPISSWTHRSKWNLANVHDPSVAFYKGYYYMYATDASYGNEHEGHGHFQGKRSKDLVNWEWIGGPFYDPPTWVADSLNAIRQRMDLDPIEGQNQLRLLGTGRETSKCRWGRKATYVLLYYYRQLY